MIMAGIVNLLTLLVQQLVGQGHALLRRRMGQQRRALLPGVLLPTTQVKGVRLHRISW